MGDDLFPNYGYMRHDRHLPNASTNYQLLDMLEQKANKPVKAFEVCSQTRGYKEFYCTDCNVLECQACLDTHHTSHLLRRVPEQVFKLDKECLVNIRLIDQKMLDIQKQTDKLDRV